MNNFKKNVVGQDFSVYLKSFKFGKIIFIHNFPTKLWHNWTRKNESVYQETLELYEMCRI